MVSFGPSEGIKGFSSPKESTEGRNADTFVRWVPKHVGAVQKDGTDRRREGKRNHTNKQQPETEDLNLSHDIVTIFSR